MNRHKQVLEIGRTVLGRGCDYSEANKLTRRIKYHCCRATEERLRDLRNTLNAAGLGDVEVKATNVYSPYAGVLQGASITLLVPINWFDE